MGLSDFEKELKTKLEDRTITPASDSWDKVMAQIEVKELKKGVSVWYWVAAITIPVLVVTSIYIKSGDEIGADVVVVDNDVATTINETDTSVSVTKESEKPIVGFTDTEEVEVSRVADTAVKEHSIVEKKVLDNSTIAELDNTTDKKLEVTKGPFDKEVNAASVANVTVDSLENRKVAQIMNKLSELNADGTEITDATVDSLLMIAQRELAMEKKSLYTNQFSNTDLMAMELLSEVENELDKSFKDKIFDALQDGYIKIKSSLAVRNP